MKGIIAIRNKSIIDNIANKCFDLGIFIIKRSHAKIHLGKIHKLRQD